MAKKSDIQLHNFFIFNPKYGPREGEEHKKILYYHPKTTDLDTKIKHVGLCEAITKFTETFTDHPCESLHTQKQRQVFLEAEKGFWMVMTLGVPYSHKVKDGQTFYEYHEDDVQDSVYHAVIHQCYNMFKLFNGTILNIVNKFGVDGLKQRLEHFFSKYLGTLKLLSSDVLDVFQGIHFLPLDKNQYLRIQCFTNLLETTFSQVSYTAFLYQDQLVWSGLSQTDMRVLYTYLTTSLFPAYLEQELQGLTPAGATATNPAGLHTHYGRFILGPPNLSDNTNAGPIPRLYVSSPSGELEECYLLVYKALSASVCLVINGAEPLTFDLCRRLDKFLGPQLSALASEISDQYPKRPQGLADTQFKYIYFNHMNLAQKSTIHTDGKKTPNVPSDILRLMADLNNDLNSCTPVEDGETIVKTCTDCWVVSKKSDQREVYIVLNHKNANLIEINEEVKRLCANHFTNIFFLD